MNDCLFVHPYHRNSSHQIEVECEAAVSVKCRKKWKLRYSRALDSLENNGQVLCLFCSRTLKFSGRGNPNCKYKTLDDCFFKTVDSEGKAYLLGWIAGDGTVQPDNHVEIVIHQKDREILEKLRDIVCLELPIWPKDDRFVGLRICSAQITNDVCNWLGIRPGDKHLDVSFPDLDSNALKWHFLRGLFDADGHVVKNHVYQRHAVCCVSSSSKSMKDSIKRFCDLPCNINNQQIVWNRESALELLGSLYDNASFFLNRKRNMYLFWREKYESICSNINSKTS